MHISQSEIRRMGVRAAAYVEAHHIVPIGGGVILVANRYETPRGVARTLTRLYGRPATIGGGEVGYWRIDAASPRR